MRIQTVAEKIKLAETGNIQVENDLSNALAGGLGGQPGIAVISGTGSNTFGCDEQNNVRMCGGWQWLLDDEGGGVGISIEAIRLSTRSWDGELPKTTLIPSLLAFFGIRDLNEILECLYLKSWTPDFLAKLTPVVMEHAQAGDVLALQCLKKGATRLVNQVKTLTQHLQFKKSKKIPVILLGGCVEKNAFYRHMIEKEIQKKKIFRIQKPLFSTAQGAIIQALKPTSIQPLFSNKKYL
jgi:glucosamine kinase